MVSAKRGCEKISEILEKNAKFQKISVVTDVLCNYCMSFLCYFSGLKLKPLPSGLFQIVGVT